MHLRGVARHDHLKKKKSRNGLKCDESRLNVDESLMTSLTGSSWNQIRSRVFSAASCWWHSLGFGHQIKVFQQSETWHKNVILFIYIYVYVLLFNLQKHSSFSHLQVGPRAKNRKQKMWVVTEIHMPLECKIEQTFLSRRWGKEYEKQIAALLPRLWNFGEPMEWAELACKGVTGNKQYQSDAAVKCECGTQVS